MLLLGVLDLLNGPKARPSPRSRTMTEATPGQCSRQSGTSAADAMMPDDANDGQIVAVPCELLGWRKSVQALNNRLVLAAGSPSSPSASSFWFRRPAGPGVGATRSSCCRRSRPRHVVIRFATVTTFSSVVAFQYVGEMLRLVLADGLNGTIRHWVSSSP